MNWVTIVWSMIATTCLTLAALQLMVWIWQRSAWANLLFVVSALSTAAIAAAELAMMRAQTPEQYAAFLRWAHVPVWSMNISLVWFMRIYFRAGRAWLAWAICAARTVALLLNFSAGANFNYQSISGLQEVLWPFGEHVTTVVAIPNWWAPLGPLTMLMMLIFFTDLAITVWRRGDRQGDRQGGFLLPGCVLFFIVCASIQSITVIWQVIKLPIMISPPFMGIIVAMGYDLSRGVHNSALLADALRESERRVDFAAAAADVGLWSRNVAGGQVWLTKKGRDHFGFNDSEEITFDRILEAIHPDDQARVHEDVNRALRNGTSYNTEYRVVTPTGKIRWLTVRADQDFDDHGQPVILRGVTIDITERKRAELEAARERSELMRLLRAATLGELSGSLAHELNQPLTAILSNAQAALRFLDNKQPDLSEVREILTDIVEDDKRAGKVIFNLKNLLKHGKVNRESIEINELIRDTLRLVQSDLMNSGVSARTDLTYELTPICGDRVQIQQVVLNLVVNACHAMAATPEKGRLIVLSTTESTSTELHLSVQDNGCGIPPENLERIFDPMFTSRPEGMGLGLAVCRTIVKAHGGRIWATNNKDQGATLHVVLPAEGLKTA